MMRWIIGSSIKFRYLVVAGAAALIAVGVLQLRDSPVDVFPEFAPPRVEIQTITLGLSAAETEELVTVPLEQALQGLPNLDTIRSKSVPLLSSITLYFERGTDQLKARQLVAERVQNVTPGLPTWAAPPVIAAVGQERGVAPAPAYTLAQRPGAAGLEFEAAGDATDEQRGNALLPGEIERVGRLHDHEHGGQRVGLHAGGGDGRGRERGVVDG